MSDDLKICESCEFSRAMGDRVCMRNAMRPVMEQVTRKFCPMGKFGEPLPKWNIPLGLPVLRRTAEPATAGSVPTAGPSERLAASGAVVTLAEREKASACVPCAKKRAAVCDNCGGQHDTARCPIPADYDGNYQNDSGGDPGCNCA